MEGADARRGGSRSRQHALIAAATQSWDDAGGSESFRRRFTSRRSVRADSFERMAIRVVQLGAPRLSGEGVRIGAVRHPPRGVRVEDRARLDFFDQWLPELAPTAALVKRAMSAPWTDARWRTFSRRYRAEMRAPAPARLIALLAALSHDADLSIGCYCTDPARCHRSVLADLLTEAGADMR